MLFKQHCSNITSNDMIVYRKMTKMHDPVLLFNGTLTGRQSVDYVGTKSDSFYNWYMSNS